MLEEKGQGVQSLLLRAVGTILVFHDRGQKPCRRFLSHHFALVARETRVSRRPNPVTLLGLQRQTPSRSGRIHRRPDPLGQAAVIAAFFGTCVEPAQVPFDGVLPLLELPSLPLPSLAQHFVTPETPRRLASGREFVTKPEIFEPLQNEEESGSFPVGQPAEGREILPPTPTRFLLGLGRAHGVQINSSISGSQLKMFTRTVFLAGQRFREPQSAS